MHDDEEEWSGWVPASYSDRDMRHPFWFLLAVGAALVGLGLAVSWVSS